MIRTKNIFTLVLVASVALLSSCTKDFDSPQVQNLPEGKILTIDSLRNLYNNSDVTFTEAYSIFGTVTADASTGNIYKELFIQDETNAIKLDLTSSADYFIGDKVRITLKGATLTLDNDMMMIDNIDPDVSIIKQESNQEVSPIVVTISEIETLVNNLSPYQSQLVQINNVEFQCSEVCKTWADAIAQSDENRYLEDTLGNNLVVRSSGFASFAGNQLPTGQGSIVAIVSQYNSTVQLTMRTPNEATMYGSRKNDCANCPIHVKNFDDNSLTSGGWSTQYPVPNNNWTTDDFPGSNPYAVVDNTSSQNVGESWLISPSFNLSAITNPEFNFKTAARTGTSPSSLKVMISTDYDGTSDPSTAAWTDITSSFTLSAGSWGWADSGNFDLSAYNVAGVHIAFKYTGSSSSHDTWEIDTFNLLDL